MRPRGKGSKNATKFNFEKKNTKPVKSSTNSIDSLFNANKRKAHDISANSSNASPTHSRRKVDGSEVPNPEPTLPPPTLPVVNNVIVIPEETPPPI